MNKKSNLKEVIVRKDIMDEEISLSDKDIFKLLRWYDGNVYNQSTQRIKNALFALRWCNNSNCMEFKSAEVRYKNFINAATSLEISLKMLTRLFQTYKDVLEEKTKRTKIIAIEGIDGTGKTIQISSIKNKLESLGNKVYVQSFPEYNSFFGTQIGDLLSGKNVINADTIDAKSMCLWYALDRLNSFKNININDYDYILLNRFTLSSAVYQSIRSDDKSIDIVSWIYELEHTQLGLPVPDLYIVFDLNPKIARENVLNKGHREYIGNDQDVYEKSDNLLEKARDKYIELSKKMSNIIIQECMKNENEMKSPEAITSEVMEWLLHVEL